MPADLELDFSANGQTVALAAGQALVLRLEENPTTGYQWSVTSSGNLRLEANDFVPACGPAVGASGLRCQRWRAQGAGTHPLELVYRRAWEPIEKAIGRFEILVVSA